MPRFDLDLHLDVRRGPGVTRSLQAGLREAIRTGRLGPGTLLPGTRSLAADLGVARGTVVEAFEQLVAEGWLVGVHGSGTRVADTVPVAPEPALQRTAEIDLRPGRPDLGAFPRSAWAASLRRALTTATPDAFDYGDPAGVPALRAAVAAYVARTRGVLASPETVVVTAGFGSGLALLARALRRLGVQTAAIEDPCLFRHRDVLAAAGLELAPLPVDGDGADPGALPDQAGLAVLTPAHQFPNGVALTAQRRAAFLARQAYLVEDDYDGEFRYDREPVGALQAANPGRVVYAGSASKALAPGLRVGWLVVPAELRQPVLDAAYELGASVPVVDQLALADFLARGDYDRHVRRARSAYRRRRIELAERLAPLPGIAAGLHALLPLDSADQERRLVAEAAARGLLLQGLHTGRYWLDPADRDAALLVGFATPPAHAWRPALDLLVPLVRS